MDDERCRDLGWQVKKDVRMMSRGGTLVRRRIMSSAGTR